MRALTFQHEQIFMINYFQLQKGLNHGLFVLEMTTRTTELDPISRNSPLQNQQALQESLVINAARPPIRSFYLCLTFVSYTVEEPEPWTLLTLGHGNNH